MMEDEKAVAELFGEVDVSEVESCFKRSCLRQPRREGGGRWTTLRPYSTERT